jgi:Na+-translocating ferredoxin:NAD+ oxidoreductase RnfG subunit
MRASLLPLALVASASVATSAFAVDYLSAAQAQSILFPTAVKWTEQNVSLNADDLLRLGKQAGLPARSAQWRIQRGVDSQGRIVGSVVVDQVIGKYELITYAVGIDTKGVVAGVEILSYRESHGSEIRLPAWRKQFVGKSLQQPIKTGEDLAIISGATLSCSHVTDGVRRITALLAVVGQ